MMKRTLVAILAMAPLATFAAPAKTAPVAEDKAGEIGVGTVEIRGDSNLGLFTGSLKSKVSGVETKTDTGEIVLGVTALYYLLPVGPGVLGFGGTLAYDSITDKTEGVDTGTTTFKLAPRVGIDVPVAPRVSAFGFGELAYLRSTAKHAFGGNDVTSSLWGIGLGGGVKYFITPSFSADAGLLLEWATGSSDTTPSADVTRFNFGLQVGLSGYFNLPKQ